LTEIPSPSQTFNGRPLPIASEYVSSMFRAPVHSDWAIRAEIEATLYGDVHLEVVTLDRRRWYNSTANAIYYLWTHSNYHYPCQIENICTECQGAGRKIEPGPVVLDWFYCQECGGRGWHYED